eukprot:330726-Rhodomonas_salina.1
MRDESWQCAGAVEPSQLPLIMSAAQCSSPPSLHFHAPEIPRATARAGPTLCTRSDHSDGMLVPARAS